MIKFIHSKNYHTYRMKLDTGYRGLRCIRNLDVWSKLHVHIHLCTPWVGYLWDKRSQWTSVQVFDLKNQTSILKCCNKNEYERKVKNTKYTETKNHEFKLLTPNGRKIRTLAANWRKSKFGL